MPIEKACENCGQPFFSYPSDNRRFCSLQCRSSFRFDKGTPSPGREWERFTCKECGGPFGMMKAYLTEYRKKYARDPLYCSRKCSAKGRRKDSEQRNTFTCDTCGETVSQSRKPGGRLYREQKYCSRECKHQGLRKQANARFEAGGYKKYVKRRGYVLFSSRHGPGQRVADKVEFAIEMLQTYPEFARAHGVMLINDPHDPLPP